MKELIEQQRAAGFPALAGSELMVRLPLREAVLNSVIQATVFRKGPAGPLKNAVIGLNANNRLAVAVELDQWPLPKNGMINAVIAPRIDFRNDPRLLIMLESSGWIGLAIKVILGLFDPLKGRVTFSDGNLFVDLKALLTKAGAAEYLPYIQRINFQSGPHILYLELYLQINEKPT